MFPPPILLQSTLSSIPSQLCVLSSVSDQFVLPLDVCLLLECAQHLRPDTPGENCHFLS